MLAEQMNTRCFIKTCFVDKISFYGLKILFFENRCNFCGRLLVCEDDVCFECREKVVFRNVDFVMPLFSYRLWNKELMFMWKSMKTSAKA